MWAGKWRLTVWARGSQLYGFRYRKTKVMYFKTKKQLCTYIQDHFLVAQIRWNEQNRLCSCVIKDR
ncbi:hypothetical protein HMPREF3192_01249 [Atopobium deltae]|uniref:Uncharacterized protein n=1 Tax=Atopobium deltae TaxID=1393034 RepID=A0A133XQD1_9ACTN|nr:hypothetical protein HMPREF3192_01249 [Atopobium deltae]